MKSLRRHRVSIGRYVSTTDEDTGIATSAFVRQLSYDADGDWWCARSVPSGRERAPTTATQHEREVVFTFDAHVPVTPDSHITEGLEHFKVTAVLPRDQFRDTIRVRAVHVDAADATKGL